MLNLVSSINPEQALLVAQEEIKLGQCLQRSEGKKGGHVDHLHGQRLLYLNPSDWCL